MIIQEEFWPLNEIVSKSKGICSYGFYLFLHSIPDASFIILFERVKLLYQQCPCQQRGFALPLISINMKYAHIEWKMCSYPHITHIICILYLLTNGYIHMRPQKRVALFTLCEAWDIDKSVCSLLMLWMGFFNNLCIISIHCLIFDTIHIVRNLTWIEMLLFIASFYFLRIWNYNTEGIGTFASTLKWHWLLLLLLLKDMIAIGNMWKDSYSYLLYVLMTKILLCGKNINVCLALVFL